VRVPCFLRQIRGARPIRDVEADCGISRGYLSLYERGRAFPSDDQVPLLEEAYGAPAPEWYPPAVLLLIERDHADDEVPA
jgi:transcriptional regulator with XRE-family HTH domain